VSSKGLTPGQQDQRKAETTSERICHRMHDIDMEPTGMELANPCRNEESGGYEGLTPTR
jgi:hypothetical protein